MHTVRLLLRHVDPRHPLVTQLVVLVFHNLRGYLPLLLRVPHTGLLCLEPGNQAGCPGTRSAGSEAANTDRRAQGNMRRPSGQGPSARLFNGLASQVEPASRAARAYRPSPGRPARRDQPSRPRTAPQSGSDLRQPTTRSPAPNSRSSATAPARRLFSWIPPGPGLVLLLCWPQQPRSAVAPAPDPALSHRHASPPAAVNAGHFSPDADSRPKTGCRRLPAGLPAIPLPPGQAGNDPP